MQKHGRNFSLWNVSILLVFKPNGMLNEIYCCDTIKLFAVRFFVWNFLFTYQIGHLIAAYVAHYIEGERARYHTFYLNF